MDLYIKSRSADELEQLRVQALANVDAGLREATQESSPLSPVARRLLPDSATASQSRSDP